MDVRERSVLRRGEAYTALHHRYPPGSFWKHREDRGLIDRFGVRGCHGHIHHEGLIEIFPTLYLQDLTEADHASVADSVLHGALGSLRLIFAVQIDACPHL